MEHRKSVKVTVNPRAQIQFWTEAAQIWARAGTFWVWDWLGKKLKNYALELTQKICSIHLGLSVWKWTERVCALRETWVWQRLSMLTRARAEETKTWIRWRGGEERKGGVFSAVYCYKSHQRKFLEYSRWDAGSPCSLYLFWDICLDHTAQR